MNYGQQRQDLLKKVFTMYRNQNIRVDPNNEYVLTLKDGRKKTVSEIMIIDFAQRFCDSKCWEVSQAIKDIKAHGHHVFKVFKKERKPDWFKTQRKATPEERRGYILCGWSSKHFTEVCENRWNGEQLTREEYYERFGTLDIE